jgi:hypothetical protein
MVLTHVHCMIHGEEESSDRYCKYMRGTHRMKSYSPGTLNQKPLNVFCAANA